jgi:hypothetical protein
MTKSGTFSKSGMFAVILFGVIGQPDYAIAKEIDLTKAVVVVPDGLSGPENKATRLLVEEVRKRSRTEWNVSLRWPTGEATVIAVGPARLIESFPRQLRDQMPALEIGKDKEGFTIRTAAAGAGPPVLAIIGNDERGVLFGIGRLLRALHLTPGRVALPEELNLTSSPKYPLRGHQLGYRPKTNSYDAWNAEEWERYIRDLAVFGTNAIELIPPRSDDAADSPHFPLPPLEMMSRMSQIAADYGLDVWIWYPAMDPDYSDPKTVEHALAEWEVVFKKLPRIDAVFVPGGDPGHTRPGPLMALLEKQSANLKRFHPRASMWVSAQSFSQIWLDEFLTFLQAEPAWLAGVVYGPQTRVSLPQLRKSIPARYPIRDYPDITHSLRCQYPVPDWDVAYSLTEAREVINPRPRDQSAIFHAFADQTIGFITYSEGCNDDVNKIVWSALGWGPDVDILEVLRQYSRYYVGPGSGDVDGFAQGLLALEQNWRGPLLANASVETTLQQFRELERRAKPDVLQNWRFQQALYRAYYDAYVRSRLIYETDLELLAISRLRVAHEIGSVPAMDQAEAILERAISHPTAAELRVRIFTLAEALFQSIHMQLSVPLYKAIHFGRGATLDTVDVPLNNRNWLKTRFNAIRKLETEETRQRGIDVILNWTNPGPGGFYDDLGDPLRRSHLVMGSAYDKDPAFLQSPQTGFDWEHDWRRSWCRHAGALFDEPLRMHYTGLDMATAYKLRIVYTGDMFQVKVRLVAGDSFEIHPYLLKPRDMTPLEFDLPGGVTRGGSLDLTWSIERGRGANGRGCQVSEVWLMKRRVDDERDSRGSSR